MENSGSCYKIITLNLLWVPEVTFLQEQNGSICIELQWKRGLSGILADDQE